MGKVNNRVEAVRKAYRDALEAARALPSAETWAKLLAAGKELSLIQEPRAGRPGRRGRRSSSSAPTIHDLEPETESRPEPELRPNSEVEMGTLD